MKAKSLKILVIKEICSWLPPGLDGRFLGGFGGIWPPRWDTISTNLTKVQSTGHSGSSGILLMLTSIVVPEKLPVQKGDDEEAQGEEEEEEYEFLGVFDIFLQ